MRGPLGGLRKLRRLLAGALWLGLKDCGSNPTAGPRHASIYFNQNMVQYTAV